MKIDEFKPIDPGKIEFTLDESEDRNEDIEIGNEDTEQGNDDVDNGKDALGKGEEASKRKEKKHCFWLRAVICLLILLAILLLILCIRKIQSDKYVLTPMTTYSQSAIDRTDLTSKSRVKILTTFRFYYLRKCLGNDYDVAYDQDRCIIHINSEQACYQIENSLIHEADLMLLIYQSDYDLTLLKELYPSQSDKHPTIVVSADSADDITSDCITVGCNSCNHYNETLRVYLLQHFYPDTIHYGLAYELMQELHIILKEPFGMYLVSPAIQEMIKPDMIDQLSFEQPALTLQDLSDSDLKRNQLLLRNFVDYLVVEHGIEEITKLLMESATDYELFKNHYEKRMNEWLTLCESTCVFTYTNSFVKPCSNTFDEDNTTYPYTYYLTEDITCYFSKDFFWHQEDRFTYEQLMEFLKEDVPKAIYYVKQPDHMIKIYFNNLIDWHTSIFGDEPDTIILDCLSADRNEVMYSYLSYLYPDKLQFLGKTKVFVHVKNSSPKDFFTYVIEQYGFQTLIQYFQSSESEKIFNGKEIKDVYQEWLTKVSMVITNG